MIIVGGGISGLSTAISIVEKNKNVQVLILEKSVFPSGASTKNAGFACFGSISELLSDIAVMGTEKCLELVNKRWSGLQKLRARFTDDELGYEALGGYELFKPSQPNYMARMEEVNTLLHPIFKADVFKNVSHQIAEKGFHTSVFDKMVFNPFEGQINTGKTIDALWKKANELGIRILTGAEVSSVDGNTVDVQNSEGVISFKSHKIVITTNAFTKALFPDLELKPGRGQVVITQPILGLKCSGTFHIDEGYFYFRNVGNRVLLGGGRNLDFSGEETTVNGINPIIESALKEILKNEILPNQKFEIDQQWSGIMAFGEEKNPILKWMSAHVLLAVRLGGMGMAIGTELGDAASDIVLNNWNNNLHG
ncbi:MAG: glycine/D-amino acid oxidase-like deaminating enzyme [Halieaceae bacterium]